MYHNFYSSNDYDALCLTCNNIHIKLIVISNKLNSTNIELFNEQSCSWREVHMHARDGCAQWALYYLNIFCGI